jgi:hypothetical protein
MYGRPCSSTSSCASPLLNLHQILIRTRALQWEYLPSNWAHSLWAPSTLVSWSRRPSTLSSPSHLTEPRKIWEREMSSANAPDEGLDGSGRRSAGCGRMRTLRYGSPSRKRLSSEAMRSAARVVGEERSFTGEGFACWASVPFWQGSWASAQMSPCGTTKIWTYRAGRRS